MAKRINEKVVNYTDKEGTERFVIAIRPKSKHHADAAKLASRTFAELVNDKNDDDNHTAILRSQLTDYMKANGLWSDEKEKELKDLIESIGKNERLLAKGNIKLLEAKELAIQIRRDRLNQTLLLAKQRELDEHTVEGQIENIRFDYLVSVCIVDENRQQIFNNIDDYYDNGDKDHVIKAVSELANMLYGLDPDWEQDLPENKFLKKYGLCNDNLHLVNEDNHLVDTDGRLINEDGRFLNKDGNFVDEHGDLVDEKGNAIEEFSPFLDEEDNPVVLED